MSRILKAPKTDRNQPSNFDETLAASFAMPASIPARSRLTTRQIRFGLIAIWVAAALLAGIGIGRIISSAVVGTELAEPAAPIAASKVLVAPTVTGSIGKVQAVAAVSINVAPAAAINQAQSGSVFTTVSIAGLQDTNSLNALQPGFNNFVTTQGNIGTDSVR